MYVESLHAELRAPAIFFLGSYCDYNPTQQISPSITSVHQKSKREEANMLISMHISF